MSSEPSPLPDLTDEERRTLPMGELLRRQRAIDTSRVVLKPDQPNIYLGKPRSFSPTFARRKKSEAARNAEANAWKENT